MFSWYIPTIKNVTSKFHLRPLQCIHIQTYRHIYIHTTYTLIHTKNFPVVRSMENCDFQGSGTFL